MDDETMVREIADEIVAYLEQHPDAAETRDGVFQIWILHQRFMRGLRALDRALKRLLDEGRIEADRLADGRLIYRAGPDLKS